MDLLKMNAIASSDGIRHLLRMVLALVTTASVSCVSVGERVRSNIAADFKYEQTWHAIPPDLNAYSFCTPANFIIWQETFIDPHFHGYGYLREVGRTLQGGPMPNHLKFIDTSRMIKQSHLSLGEVEDILRKEGVSATAVLCLPVWFADEWGEGAVDYPNWINSLLNDSRIRKTSLARWRYSTTPSWSTAFSTYKFTSEFLSKSLRKYP